MIGAEFARLKGTAQLSCSVGGASKPRLIRGQGLGVEIQLWLETDLTQLMLENETLLVSAGRSAVSTVLTSCSFSSVFFSTVLSCNLIPRSQPDVRRRFVLVHSAVVAIDDLISGIVTVIVIDRTLSVKICDACNTAGAS
nr:hypothetical protein BaRGS_008179 [Batillaria attramentaria]